jgi:KilA-N domain
MVHGESKLWAFQAAGRPWSRYWELPTAKAFAQELSFDLGIPISTLIQSMKGGDIRFQGTWVHPQVAINLAQWLSARFAVQVSQWIYDWMSGSAPASVADAVPYHLRRYVANQPNVPVAHFSVLTEMTQMLIAPLVNGLGRRGPANHGQKGSGAAALHDALAIESITVRAAADRKPASAFLFSARWASAWQWSATSRAKNHT